MKELYKTSFESKLNFYSLTSPENVHEIKIDFLLNDLLSTSYNLLGRLEGFAEGCSETETSLPVFIRKEANNSCLLEGLKTSLAFSFMYDSSTKNSKLLKDVPILLNYICALKYGLIQLKSSNLSLSLLSEVLKILSGNQRTQDEKTENNLTKLNNLDAFLKEDSRIPVLIKAGMLHFYLMNIKPLGTFSGMIARLLIVFYLFKQNVLSKPLLCLSDYFKKYALDYYEVASKCEEKESLENWLKFFLSGIITSANSSIETIRRVRSLVNNDTKKVQYFGRTYEKAITLLKFLFSKPVLNVKEVEEITGLSNPNALLLISKFVNCGILEEITGQKRNRLFGYTNYIKLFE